MSALSLIRLSSLSLFRVPPLSNPVSSSFPSSLAHFLPPSLALSLALSLTHQAPPGLLAGLAEEKSGSMQWKTSFIQQRDSATRIRTSSGSIYVLEGPMDACSNKEVYVYVCECLSPRERC